MGATCCRGAALRAGGKRGLQNCSAPSFPLRLCAKPKGGKGSRRGRRGKEGGSFWELSKASPQSAILSQKSQLTPNAA